MYRAARWTTGNGRASALRHLARGIAFYDRATDRGLALVYGDDPGVDCLAYASMARWWLGQCDRALVLRDEAVALAREIAHPFTLGRALAFSCMLDVCRRSFAPLVEVARELLELATEHKLANWKGVAQMLLHIGRIQQGNGAPEDALFDRGWAQFRATGARILTRFWPALLADVHARAGNVDAGRAALRRALDADDSMAFWDAELARIEGDLAAQGKGADATVETPYQRALSISRRQGARALELRAATSVARFWSRRGRTNEAAALLTPVYEGFTEGLDAPDLRDAKALLDAFA